MDSEVLKHVIDDMRQREAKGKKEYGTTLDRQDLSETDWMDYAYEEALDLSLYLKKIILNRTEKVI